MHTTLSHNTRNLIAMQAVIIGIQLYFMHCACANDYSGGIELVCADDNTGPRFTARNYMPDHDGDSETFKEKSCFFGVAPTFVPVIGPIIGHMYIGRANAVRGLHYGLLQVGGSAATLICAIGYGDGGRSSASTIMAVYTMWAYLQGIIDAGTSVYNHNNRIPEKSCAISVGSAMVCPYLSSIYLGKVYSPLVVLSTVGFVGGITSGCPAAVVSSLLFGAFDAASSTKRYNENLRNQQTSNVTIIPDLESRMLKVAWTF